MRTHLVTLEEIQKYEYTLAINRYMPDTEPEDLFDLKALIHGGFPSMDIDTIKQKSPRFEHILDQIFDKRINEPYYDLKVPKDNVDNMVHTYISKEFLDHELEEAWKQRSRLSILVDRYGKSLIELEREHAVMKETVNNHLKRMGIL